MAQTNTVSVPDEQPNPPRTTGDENFARAQQKHLYSVVGNAASGQQHVKM